jgi:hypothetical protein
VHRRLVLVATAVVCIGVGCWCTLRSEPTASPSDAPRPADARDDSSVRRDESARRGAERAARKEREAEAPADVGVTLTVHVLVKGRRDSVPGAAVVVIDDEHRRHTATADATGVARIERFVGDSAEVETTAAGFTRGWTFAWKHDVRSGEPIEVLVEKAVSIDGVVREASGGRGVAGARVEIDGPNRPLASAVTAVDGTFHIDGAPAERKYRDDDGSTRDGVSLWAYERNHVASSAYWHPTDVGPVEIRMASAGVLRGRVSDPTGAPAAANVKAKPSRKPRGPDVQFLAEDSAETDADGRYELGGLPLGFDWRVVATAPKFADSAVCTDVVLEPGRTDAVRDFVLRQASQLVVHVLQPDGTPAENASLRLVVPDGYTTERITDAAGSSVFERLEPGAYSLGAEFAGLAATVVAVELAAGERRVVDVRLEPGATLAGVVVDDVGAPVAKASIEARMAGTGPAAKWRHKAESAADGTFHIDGLPPGALAVDVAASPGYETLSGASTTAPASDARFVLRRNGFVSFRLRVPADARRPTSCSVALRPETTREGLIRDLPWTDDEFRVPVGVGKSTVTIDVRGFLAVTRTVDVASAAVTSLGEIALDPGVTLEGRVVDAEGRPVAGAAIDMVTIFPVDAGTPWPAPRLARVPRGSRTRARMGAWILDADASGRFRVEHSPPGRWTFIVFADGYADTVVTTDVAAGAPPLVVVLHRGGVLRGTIRDAAGSPASGVDVDIAVGEPPAIAASLDKSGTFSLRVRDGRAHVVVRRGDATVATRDVDVREGEETSVEIALER